MRNRLVYPRGRDAAAPRRVPGQNTLFGGNRTIRSMAAYENRSVVDGSVHCKPGGLRGEGFAANGRCLLVWGVASRQVHG